MSLVHQENAHSPIMFVAFIKGCPHCQDLLTHTSFRLSNARFLDAQDGDGKASKVMKDIQELFAAELKVPFVVVVEGEKISKMTEVYDAGFVTFKLDTTKHDAAKSELLREMDNRGGVFMTLGAAVKRV
jgi:hypothetical protein